MCPCIKRLSTWGARGWDLHKPLLMLTAAAVLLKTGVLGFLYEIYLPSSTLQLTGAFSLPIKLFSLWLPFFEGIWERVDLFTQKSGRGRNLLMQDV